jgi:serine/threonine protein kinase
VQNYIANANSLSSLAARNVLLDKGVPRIADFGQSRLTDGPSKKSTTKSETGPLRWMSPEAIGEREYSEKSDVWMFGATLVEIVTAQEPFPGDDNIAVALAVRDGTRTPQVPETTSPLVREVAARCFTFKADERPSFHQIVALLEDEGSSVSTSSSEL